MSFDKEEGQYSCDLCFYVAKDRAEMIGHIKIHDAEKKMLTPSKKRKRGKACGVKTKKAKEEVKCDLCDFTAKDFYWVKSHRRKVHEGVKYSCDLCDFKSTQLRHLTHHKKRDHEKVRYPCDQCEYSATKPDYLKKHKESKHLGIRYYCDKCTSSFSKKIDLKYHCQTIHEGKGLQCEFCDFVAAFPTLLQSHIETKHKNKVKKVPDEEGVKNFLCDKCSFSSLTNVTLLAHIANVHTAEFKCSDCNYKSKFKGNLSKHQILKHGPTNTTCTLCEFSSDERSEMKEHIVKIHPELVASEQFER